jgi:O-antigen ligase
LHEIVHRQFFSILETAQNYSDSPYGKLWNAGIDMGLKNWIFGIGPMHFESYCNDMTDFCRYHPHNIYIELFAETGIIGLGIFLYLFFSIAKIFLANYTHYKNIDKLIQPLAIGCFIAIIMKLLPIPSSGFFKNWYAVPLWLMVGWLLCLGNNKTKRTKL